ncbi:microcin C ABC transporter permease YejB [Telmatospirillum sp. J64-1]|uniref:microcin C ABC transporter permease YejB n=1 Tax=Telmatospirillum sp. J64-1 TaxID=2502183 RepID=UPI00115DC6AB|nr:microcin C ABC transporter permease YejB [Telmatospirillum sp. J64-1]
MFAYIVRRLLLIPVTLFGIMVVNFVFVQLAPGGPIEQVLAQLEGTAVDATARIGGTGGGEAAQTHTRATEGPYRGAQGLPPDFIAELERQFGFDKPAHERFFQMMANYATFDFGSSFYRDQSVVDLVLEKLPVSISLGVWSTLIIYLVSIPLGIRKAVSDGSKFDVTTSWMVIIGYAIPAFLFAILLIVLFAGGRFLDWFPLRGLTSLDWHLMSWPERILDYIWHLTLPVTAMVIGGFAGLTMLTKNSFLEEINKQYVITAKAKGLTQRQVLYGHVFRNAMLLIVAGFPSALVGMLFTGSVLIEVIFSLDGLGLLGFEAVINRDYPVIFGTLYAFGLIGLLLNLISDITYHIVDPRIDFEKREA